MQGKSQDEQCGAGPTGENASPPPCCGSGCAVCVLDYWTPDEPGAGTRPADEAVGSRVPPVPDPSAEPAETDLLALLEAFEEAELEAQRIITQLDGESKS
ncbi:MAG TPA: hypothetical protein VJ302_14780 [Blastocatellia bacterium]|nr:hypothetical protein [Blastocatellia bacterium]